jgi:hypothetical protein
MRRVVPLLFLLVGCAGRAAPSTLPVAPAFVGELPHDGVAYASLDVHAVRENALVQTIVAASRNPHAAPLIAAVDTIAMAARPRDAHGELPMVAIVRGTASLELFASFFTAWELEVASVESDGHRGLRVSVAGGASIDLVECAPEHFMLGTSPDVSNGCEGFEATAPSNAFTRMQAVLASLARTDLAYVSDAPCDMHVLDGRTSARTGTNEPTHLPGQRCAMSAGLSFEHGLEARITLDFEDVIRLDDYRRVMSEWLPFFSGALRANPGAFSELVAFVEHAPTRPSAAFAMRFTEEDVAGIVARNAVPPELRERPSGLHATTSMAEVFAALDARIARLAEPPRDLVRTTGDAPKGLLVYLPDLDEPTDRVPEAVLAFAQTAVLDVLVVEPTERLGSGTFSWSESPTRHVACSSVTGRAGPSRSRSVSAGPRRSRP